MFSFSSEPKKSEKEKLRGEFFHGCRFRNFLPEGKFGVDSGKRPFVVLCHPVPPLALFVFFFLV